MPKVILTSQLKNRLKKALNVPAKDARKAYRSISRKKIVSYSNYRRRNQATKPFRSTVGALHLRHK